jgi:eukaryotic translation initiation factor 2C
MDSGVEKFQAIIKRDKQVKHPLRPGFGTLGTPILVRANFFALKFPKGMIIYDYKMDITPKTDIGQLKGRIIELLEESPDFAAHRAHVAHDRSERMVSSRELPQPLAVDILFREEWEETARANAKQYRVAITLTEDGELNTDDLNE